MEAKGSDQQKKGTVVIATVKGDIHDIGKNIVKVLLENYSFDSQSFKKNRKAITVTAILYLTSAAIFWGG